MVSFTHVASITLLQGLTVLCETPARNEYLPVMGSRNAPNERDESDPYNLPSYAGLPDHQGLLLAHIVLMVFAWFIILPVGREQPFR
jgi:hypothetical protein